jgi:hypothetical protein
VVLQGGVGNRIEIDARPFIRPLLLVMDAKAAGAVCAAA